MKHLVLVLLSTLTFSMAFAQGQLHEITPHGKKGWYSTGSTLAHRFDQPTYVERMLISAVGNRDFAKAYVYADGEQVSLLGVPGTDPDYPEVVRKTISSIVIKFEGQVNILDFRIWAGGHAQESFNRYNFHNLESPAQLGRAVIQVIAQLQESVSYSDFNNYLLPLRKSALVLAAKGMGRPLLSSNTQALTCPHESVHLLSD
ncbi:MAG: hypothetical protein ACK5V3_12195 [Bdellovibrionales bacterium]